MIRNHRTGVGRSIWVLAASLLTALSLGSCAPQSDSPEQRSARYEKQLSKQIEKLGPTHEQVATTLFELGLAYADLNRNEDAARVFERALEIREASPDHDTQSTADLYFQLGKSYGQIGRNVEAVHALDQALVLQGTLPRTKPADRADILDQLGVVYGLLNRNDEALAALGQALVIWQNGTDENPEKQAFTLIQMGHIHRQLTLLKQALTDYQQALELLEQITDTDPIHSAQALNKIGIIFDELEQNNKGLQAFERALVLLEQTKDPELETLSDTLNNQSLLNLKIARYDEALSGFNRVLALMEKQHGPAHLQVAVVLLNLGHVYQKMAHYDLALKAYGRAMQIRRQAYGSDHVKIAEVLMGQGNVLGAVGRYDDAIITYQQALYIFEKNQKFKPVPVAETLNNLGILYRKTNRPDQATQAYKRVIQIFEQAYGPTHPKLANVLNNLGLVHYDLGQYETALADFSRSLAIKEATFGRSHSQVASVLGNLGRVYRKQGKYDAAMSVYGRALAIRKGENPPHLEGLRHTYTNLANLRHTLDDTKGTILFAKLAVNTQQQIRAQNADLDQDMARSLTERSSGIYYLLSDALLADDRVLEAMFVLDLLKQRELFEFIRGDTTAAIQKRIGFSGNEADQAQELEAALDSPLALGREARSLRIKQDEQDLSATDTARLATLETALDAAYEQFDAQLETLLAQAQSEETDVQLQIDRLNLQSAGIQNILEDMEGRAVLLRLASLQSGLHLFVTTSELSIDRTVQISRKDLAKLVFSALSAVENRAPDAKDHLQALYDVLIRPVTADLAASGADTIMLNLDGFLRYVPFSALYDGEHYLIEDYALAQHTPAADTDYDPVDRDGSSAVGFGVTDAHAELGFSALPGVGTEMEAIFTGKDETGSLQGQPLLNANFNASSFQQALKSHPQIIHVASHFKFVPGSETDSFLLLGTGEALTLEQIRKQRGFNFRKVDLLTLSACSTARGGDANGSEVESFSAVAQNKGVGAVMATLWPVADASTAQLMTDFYAGLIEDDLDKAQALRMAQLALLHGTTLADARTNRGAISLGNTFNPSISTPAKQVDTSHPYFWAPFILMGNWL